MAPPEAAAASAPLFPSRATWSAPASPAPVQRAGDGEEESPEPPRKRHRGLPWEGNLPPLPASAALAPAPAPPPAIAPIRPENLDPVSRLHAAAGGEEAADRLLGQALIAQGRAASQHGQLVREAAENENRTVAALADPEVPFVASSDQLRGRPRFHHPGGNAGERKAKIADLARELGHEFRTTRQEPLGWAQLHAEPTVLHLQAPPSTETAPVPLTPTQSALPTGVSRNLCTVGGGPGNCEGLFRAAADRSGRPRAIADPRGLHLFPPHEPPLHAPFRDLLVPTLPGPDRLAGGFPAVPPPAVVPDAPASGPVDPRLSSLLQETARLHARLPRETRFRPGAPEALREAHRQARQGLLAAAPDEREERFHAGSQLQVAAIRRQQPFRRPPDLPPVAPRGSLDFLLAPVSTLEPEHRPAFPQPRLSPPQPTRKRRQPDEDRP